MSLIEYETTIVIRPDIGGDAVEATLDRVREVIKQGSGKLLAISHWGKKKLAYAIQKHVRGIYVHTHFLAKNDLVLELERHLRIADQVLRFLTVRLATDVVADEHEEKTYVRPQYDVDDANDNDNEPSFVLSDDREERFNGERSNHERFGDERQARPSKDEQAAGDASESEEN